MDYSIAEKFRPLSQPSRRPKGAAVSSDTVKMNCVIGKAMQQTNLTQRMFISKTVLH